jgi:predicted enzyme related to lactoylglutathione lyase
VSETAATAIGKIVWFEVPAADTQRARDFYGRLFEWQFEPFGDHDYHATYEAGGAISAIDDVDGVLVYFGTDDIAATVRRVRELGGDAADVETVAGVGSYSRCTDSEGNAFGLYSSEGAE